MLKHKPYLMLMLPMKSKFYLLPPASVLHTALQTYSRLQQVAWTHYHRSRRIVCLIQVSFNLFLPVKVNFERIFLISNTISAHNWVWKWFTASRLALWGSCWTLLPFSMSNGLNRKKAQLVLFARIELERWTWPCTSTHIISTTHQFTKH